MALFLPRRAPHERLAMSNHGAVLFARGKTLDSIRIRRVIAKILDFSFAKIATNSY
jgi:hypothetical protein